MDVLIEKSEENVTFEYGDIFLNKSGEAYLFSEKPNIALINISGKGTYDGVYTDHLHAQEIVKIYIEENSLLHFPQDKFSLMLKEKAKQ